MLLYLHIPFCDSKCHYCAFNSYTRLHHLQKRYMGAIVEQLRYELERFGATPGSITSLFIGGGTPSTVPPERYAPFFELLTPYLHEEAEITTEANPGSATLEWLQGMRALGVTRVSFGVQSFDAKKLEFLGRSHTPTLALEAPWRAKEAGFVHISIDLIYGSALDTRALLSRDLHLASSLPIDHLSAYALTLEEGTPFYTRPEVQRDDADLARWFGAQIEDLGFTQYEISNFGRYRCRHNLGYWRYEDYIGIGSGAVGFLRNRRFYPLQDPLAYCQAPRTCTRESLSAEDIVTEKVLLGLRSEVGVKESILTKRQKERARMLVEEEKLRLKAGVLYNTCYYLSDEIALFILE